MKILFLTGCALLIFYMTNAQSIGINKETPHQSAILDIESNEKGILIPRMTIAQREAIDSPALGLLVFQTDGTPGFFYYDGTLWVTLGIEGPQGEPGPAGLEGPQGAPGISGTDGEDGISIIWLGSFANAPSSPSLNQAYYNTTLGQSLIWNGAAWNIIAQDGSSADAWSLSGNEGVSSDDFLGTTDAQTLRFRTNNQERMTISGAGNVGLGVPAANEKLEIRNGNALISNTTNTAGELRLAEPSNSGLNYTSFKAQPQDINIDYTLPARYGAEGAVLTTNSTGTLRWETIGLKYLGELRADIGSSGSQTINSGVWTVVDWISIFSNFNNALNVNTDIITIPPGVSKIKISLRVAFNNGLLDNSTVHYKAAAAISLNGSEFGWSGGGISTSMEFLLFNGLNYTSPLLEVFTGDTIDVRVFQNNGVNIGLKWGAVNNTYLTVEYYE